jgi:hypothetical protein
VRFCLRDRTVGKLGRDRDGTDCRVSPAARHHCGILATFIALSGTAYTVGGSGDNFHACVDTSTGTVRIARHCHQSEHAVTWAKTGPQGPAGPVGHRTER